MKIEVDRKSFAAAVNQAAGIINSRCVLPILEHVLIEAKGETLTVRSTNLAISIKIVMQINAGEDGAVTVPGKRFSDILKRSNATTITLELDDKNDTRLHVKAGSGAYRLCTLPVIDFPAENELNEYQTIEMSLTDFKKSFAAVVSAAAISSDARQSLQGVHIESKDGIMSFVSTDGKRLHVAEMPVNGVPDGIECILPLFAVNEIAKMSGADSVVVMVSAREAMIICGSMTLWCKLIDGNYPNWRQVMPPNSASVAVVKASEMVARLESVAGIMSDRSGALDVTFDAGKLAITAASAFVGEASETMEITYDGDKRSYMINPAFMIAALKAGTIADAKIMFGKENTPLKVIGDKCVAIIMPIHKK